MRHLPAILRFGISPLLLGAGVGITFFLCTLIDRIQTARIEERFRVDAMAVSLTTQNRNADTERNKLAGEIRKHQKWAETRWTELDNRLRLMEVALGIDMAGTGETPGMTPP